MRALFGIAALALALAACAGTPAPEAVKTADRTYDPKLLPPGPLGHSIREGHDILVETRAKMPSFVRADMSCAACHLDAGLKSKGGNLVGVYGRFPQWNQRSRRIIALQDRITECFLYSMNGRAPGYASREMIALVSYMAWISRGIPMGEKQREGDRFIVPLPSAGPDSRRGAAIYAQKCATCHRADGAGVSGTFPPLWGKSSFNGGAGMAHLDRMTGFVYFNMPQNAPRTLSVEEAYDVAAFVLSHPRPHFDGNAVVAEPAKPARYY
ncbi:MAG: c-type cytochrome [Candidatus Eremiobacteraeota bacterium]|nr:c-type cytochrome [Candidatus Eremiobacteraeota bacterium]MBV8435652.1 c-type cytochrome [Candidatus Eremiobacteraeota bacterium]MBV8583985.1 c-type cytochrome [Candidatus Eremiobacteraeota bacterium]